MSQPNDPHPDIVGSPSGNHVTHSDVVAHLRESTQKIESLERQIAQLYTFLNEKYASNNNTSNNTNNDTLFPNPQANNNVIPHSNVSTGPPTPTLEDVLPNAANFLHMRRRKKKRHRKKLLDLRGRVSLTPSIRSPNAPLSPVNRYSISQPNPANNTPTIQHSESSTSFYPNLLRSNLNMRVINTTPAPSQTPSTTNPKLYESDSRLVNSMSELPVEPSSPLYVRRSSESSSSDSTVQSDDSDTNHEPPHSIRVSVKPPSVEANNNNSHTFSKETIDALNNQQISFEPGTETPPQPSRSEQAPREVLRKTSSNVPYVASAFKTDDNDVEIESITASLEQRTESPPPQEEPKDINNQQPEPHTSPPPQPPPSVEPTPHPIERKETLKNSKIRDVLKEGIKKAKSVVGIEKPQPAVVSPPPTAIEPQRVQTQQALESELEGLLFSSTEGLWETRDVDGAPKLFNISIILENYDDIFSDFDPRPFSVRTVSDDFLDECRRRIARVPNKSLKEFGQLALLVPGKRRDTAAEQIIIRRLQQHFNRGYSIQRSENLALWRRGFIWIIGGMIITALTFVLQVFQEEQEGPAYWTMALLNISLAPAGSFFFWEGLEHLFFYVRENSTELEFYRDMSKISFQFHTIDASLQSKLRLAYANYRGQ